MFTFVCKEYILASFDHSLQRTGEQLRENEITNLITEAKDSRKTPLQTF